MIIEMFVSLTRLETYACIPGFSSSFGIFFRLVIGCVMMVLSVSTLLQLLPLCFHSCTHILSVMERLLDKVPNHVDHFDAEIC